MLLHQFHDVEVAAFVVKEYNEKWPQKDIGQWAQDCITVIKQDGIERQIENLREKIREAVERMRNLLAAV